MAKRTKPEDEELQQLRDEVKEAEKWATEDYYRKLLLSWAYVPLAFLVGLGTSGLILWSFPTLLDSLPVTSLSSVEIRQMISTYFGAIVTVNGIVMSLVPVSSFFFLKELRFHEQGLESHRMEKKENSKGEKRQLIIKLNNLSFVSSQNLRRAVLKYTQTYLVTAVLLQIVVVSFYLSLLTSSIGVFVLISFLALVTTCTGMLPVVRIAMYQPGYKVLRVKMGDEEQLIIAAELE